MSEDEHRVRLPRGLDHDKLAECALALLSLTLHEGRVWKSLDWDLTNLLFKKGWISDPISKAKSVILTEEGQRLAETFLIKHFSGSEDTPRPSSSTADLFATAEFEESLRLLEARAPDLAAQLAACPRHPISRPPLHNAGPGADYLRLSASVELVEAVIDALGDAVASAAQDEPPPEFLALEVLLDRWLAYQRRLEGPAA